MQDLTGWALAKARELVECEGSALIGHGGSLQLKEIEARSTLLTVAISDALLEAFAKGTAATGPIELAPDNAK